MRFRAAILMVILAGSMALVGCSGSTYGQETTDNGVRIVAKNASEGSEATSEGALVLDSDATVMVSPTLESGSVHVSIVSDTSKLTVFDEDVSGTQPEMILLAAGTYSVTSSSDDATGEVLVSESTQMASPMDSDAFADSVDKFVSGSGKSD